MASDPLSTPRNDPTASDAIRRAESPRRPTPLRRPHTEVRVVYHPGPAPARERVPVTDAEERLYRMYRFFHHYTQGDKEMPEAHRAFLVEVRRTLKAAGYRTRDPAGGDPLGGDA